MPLPGKLCIGILEEDNPLKSYFCFKPLLIEENGQYIPFDDIDAYPEDGCIRIVPDKNESSHFKARMRRIGLFAVVDLREHPNDNDKIRANKNYRGDNVERNAHIIYSDVVREPSANMIFALLAMRPEEAETAVLQDAPCAAKILLRPEDTLLEGVWAYETAEDETFRMIRDSAEIDLADLQVFDIPGFRETKLSFAILPPSKIERVSEPALVKPVKNPQPALQELRKESDVPKAEATVAAQPAPAPAAAVSEDVPAPVSAPAPTVSQEDKPWISKSSLFTSPNIDSGLSLQQRAILAQSGLNPRRSRSVKEIIDDKWKRSRIDQLGHSVEEIATGVPVLSPAEFAIAALNNAWANRADRQSLTDAIVHLEGAELALDARRSAIRESAVNEQLNELEAQRLKMLADLETLKKNGANVREALKLEIRKDEAALFADAVQKSEQAIAECARHEAKAAEAKAAAQSVEDALNMLADGRFEKRLHEFAINSQAVRLLHQIEEKIPSIPETDGSSATADELILRVRTCFADAGQLISQTDAINLLVCAAQSPMLIVSGAPGTGKTSLVRLLARALGIEETHFESFAPGKADLSEDDRVKALRAGSAAAIALLDDANLAYSEDLTRALYPAAEQGMFTLCASVQDEGAPLPAYLLSRSFMLRLTEDMPDAPWQPKEVSASRSYEPVSREAFRAAFAPKLSALPPNLTKRMEKLRGDLAVLGIRLSRSTLNALWRYCAAAIPLMPIEPSAVLDMALAQRALPAILAGAPIDALAALPKIMADLPRCKALLAQPIPVNL